MAMAWFAEGNVIDADLRVQALGRLIPTDAPKVIPILRNIALETDNPGAARRAVFVLAQSRNPEAQSIVVDVAKAGPEPVRVAAVRELARFGGPDVGQELLDVYARGNQPVKQQVVFSLGERADTSALYRIVQTENNGELRDAAILTLGRAGGREQLRVLFVRASRDARQAVIRGLFLARDEDGLIKIAGQEKDPELKAEIIGKLRLLGTPKANEYLATAK
jgi:HEAT repeat protein